MHREVVLLRPYSMFGERFVQTFYEQFGLRSIVVHTGWKDRLLVENRFPTLSSKAVSAHYMLGPGGWPEITEALRRDHRVVAVAPHEEGAVAPLGQLAADLGLSWAQPEVLPAFRAKDSLKSLVRRNDPSVRLNHHCLVRSGEEAFRAASDRGIPRFVLKPDDGVGNTDVAFFDTADGPSGPAAYFEQHPGSTLFEEYIGGEEYFVNGQVDAAGEVSVFGVSRYLRGPANGRENIELGIRSVLTADPRHQMLADYARTVMRATGLVRSPFHLEAKVDDAGPCLIEVGARLGGDQTASLDGWRLGGSLDPVEVAVHYYATDEPHAPLEFDWAFHDSHPTGSVKGVSEQDGRVYQLQGIREVEALPGFITWVRRLQVGDRLEVTRNLTSKPYAVEVWAPTPEAVDEVDRQVRELVRWNSDPRARARARGGARIAANLARKAVDSRPRWHMRRSGPMAPAVSW